MKCPMKFRNRYLLHRHLKTAHSDAKDVVCDICGMAFKMKEKMTRHKKVVHEEWKSISCDLCDRKFSERGTYKYDDNYYTIFSIIGIFYKEQAIGEYFWKEIGERA